MRRPIAALTALSALPLFLLAACEDGPKQFYSASPAGAATSWNDQQTPPATDNAKAGFQQQTGGTNKQELCDGPTKKTTWEKMDHQPIIPLVGAGGLDVRGGDSFKGLTIDEAEQQLCQSDTLGDEFGDGNQTDAWGGQDELWAEYIVSSRRIDQITVFQGYEGAMTATYTPPAGSPVKLPDGSSTNEPVTFQVPIQPTFMSVNGQEFKLSWQDYRGTTFKKQVDTLYRAMVETYLKPLVGADVAGQLTGDPSTNCYDQSRCISNDFGDEAYIYIPVFGIGFWNANHNDPTLNSKLERQDILVAKIMPYFLANPLLKFDDEGPTTVGGTPTGCTLKMGQTFGDFRAKCVETSDNDTDNTNAYNRLIGGITHGTERFHFDVQGIDLNFTDTDLPADDVIRDADLPTDADVATEYDIDQSLLGKIANDYPSNDPTTQVNGKFVSKDLHGSGLVYLEYARLVQDELNKYIDPSKQHQLGDPACLPDLGGSGDDTGDDSGDDSSAAGASGDDSSAGTSGDDSSAGTSGDDSSAGTAGDDSSEGTSGGGSGDDSSAGTAGDDSSAGTSGDDSSAGAGGDTGAAGDSGDDSSAGAGGAAAHHVHRVSNQVTERKRTTSKVRHHAKKNGRALAEGCTGFEGFITAAPPTDPSLADVNANLAPLALGTGAASIGQTGGLALGLKCGSPIALFCNDANGDPTSGYADCVEGPLFATSFNQVLDTFGGGVVGNMPADVKDVRFFFKQYVRAFVKYLLAVGAGDETIEGVHKQVLNPNDIFFDSLGAGQFEQGEYIDRTHHSPDGAPTDFVIGADVKDGIMDDYSFSRDVLRGETAIYDAIANPDETSAGTPPYQQEHAALTNIFGSPVLAAAYPGTGLDGKDGYYCATNLDNDCLSAAVPQFPPVTPEGLQALFGGSAPTDDQFLRDDAGNLLLAPYAGAFGGETAFTLGTQHLTITKFYPNIESAMVHIPTFENPYDANDAPTAGADYLIPWLQKSPDVGFPIAITGTRDKFISTAQLDFSGNTIDANIDYDVAKDANLQPIPPDPTTGAQQIQILAVESDEFLGNVFLCQDQNTFDLLYASMYTPVVQILDWLDAHPGSKDACGIILTYSPYDNYLDYVTSLSAGVRLGITQGGGFGRVVDVSLNVPGL